MSEPIATSPPTYKKMHSVPKANRGRVSRLNARRMGVCEAGGSTKALRYHQTAAAITINAIASPDRCAR